MNNITTLLNQIGEITKRHEEIAKLSGENFNVFKVIGVTTKEVQLHSRFLAELLNPNGSHGQGDVFLKIFISDNDIKEFETTNASVIVEKHIGDKTETEGGYIDILIKSGNGKIIIIENKIYADDQDNQLLRYSNYSKDNLFYLTLFGNEPDEKSYGKLEINKDFKLISYKDDILNWLIKCRKEAVQQPLLREGISHYINVIKFLTGQSMNEEMSGEITKKLTTSSENMRNAINISKNINYAKTEIQWAFWEKLDEKLKEKELENKFIKCNKTVIENKEIADNYYSKNRIIDFGILIEVEKINDFTIVYSILLDDFIYFAIKIMKDNEFIEIDTENEKIIKLIEKFKDKYSNKTEWSVWKYTEPQLNFREFDENVTKLADNNYLERTVKNIADKAIQDIEQFKKAIEKLEN